MSYFNKISDTAPSNDTKNPYRPIETPGPIKTEQEVRELLARGRELIDNQLWLASEWLSTSELLSHQQAASENPALQEPDITEAINRALTKCARQSGRTTRAEITAFRFASHKRRITNLERRSTTQPTINFTNDLTHLGAAILAHESRKKSRMKNTVTFAPLPPPRPTTHDGTAAPPPSKGCTPRPNPDTTHLDRWPNSETLHLARTTRFTTHAPRISYFASRTSVSRAWAAFSVSRQTIRSCARIRVAKRIPELEAELARAKQDVVDLERAEREEEVRFGEKMRQGRIDAERLEGYEKYLGMESDKVPDLDEDGFVVGAREDGYAELQGEGKKSAVGEARGPGEGNAKGKERVTGLEVDEDDEVEGLE